MTFKIWGTEDLTRSVAPTVELPSITALANGGYVAMWLEGSEKLFYQVYDGNGVKATPQPLELQAGAAQTPPLRPSNRNRDGRQLHDYLVRRWRQQRVTLQPHVRR